MAGRITITVSLLSRHKQYLDALAKTEGQKRSDTVRRALDEYAAKYPVAIENGQLRIENEKRQDDASTEGE